MRGGKPWTSLSRRPMQRSVPASFTRTRGVTTRRTFRSAARRGAPRAKSPPAGHRRGRSSRRRPPGRALAGRRGDTPRTGRLRGDRPRRRARARRPAACRRGASRLVSAIYRAWVVCRRREPPRNHPRAWRRRYAALHAIPAELQQSSVNSPLSSPSMWRPVYVAFDDRREPANPELTDLPGGHRCHRARHPRDRESRRPSRTA